jgi:DNA-binding transcriptional regulator YbjK
MQPMRLDAKSRRKMIIEAARIVADRDGEMRLTPEAVAKECAVSTSVATVRRYFLTMGDLRDALRSHAPK